MMAGEGGSYSRKLLEENFWKKTMISESIILNILGSIGYLYQDGTVPKFISKMSVNGKLLKKSFPLQVLYMACMYTCMLIHG